MTKQDLLKTAKPILFNTDMVQAILDGRKSATRRVIKLKYDNTHIEICNNKYGKSVIELQNQVEGETFGVNPDGTHFQKLLGAVDKYPPYKRGNILYVREAWCKGTLNNIPEQYYYKADNVTFHCKWHPSIHMPKEAARIFLRVTDVRVERLQDIIENPLQKGEKALFPVAINREGLIEPCSNCYHPNGECIDFLNKGECKLYKEIVSLWNSTIPKKDHDIYGWDANPWVWVIEFERIEVEE